MSAEHLNRGKALAETVASFYSHHFIRGLFRESLLNIHSYLPNRERCKITTHTPTRREVVEASILAGGASLGAVATIGALMVSSGRLP